MVLPRSIGQVFLFLALWSALAAQVDPPEVATRGTPFLRNFSQLETQGSPVNWQIRVHPNGFIYAGNNLRVLEYDGDTWNGYRIPRALAPDVFEIDARGRVWAPLEEEINRFEPNQTGVPTSVDRSALLPEAKRHFGRFLRSASSADGVYFSSEKMLVRIDSADRAQTWDAVTNFESLWIVDGVLHTTQTGRGLFQLRNEKLVETPLAKPLPVVFAGKKSGASDLLLLTERGPIVLADTGEWRALSVQSAALFRHEAALSACALSDGRLAFGTVTRGVYVFTAEGKLEQHIDETRGLSSDRVNGLAEDAEGGLWLALHNGIARLQIVSPYATHPGYRGSVRALIRHDGKIYIGHAQGVSVMDPHTGAQSLLAGAPANTNGTICFVEVGDRLLASVSGIREVTRDGQLKLIAPVQANHLIASRRHAGWFFANTPSRGFWIFEPQADGSWKQSGPAKNIPTNLVRLLDTGDGFIWGAANNGELWRADFRNGPSLDATVEIYDVERGVPKAERNDYRELFVLGDSVVASNRGGMLRYDASENRFVPEERIANLPEKKPDDISPLDDGSYWLKSGNGGLASTGVFVLHAKPDGVDRWSTEALPLGPLNRVSINTTFAEPALSTIWFGTQVGVLSARMDWPTSPQLTPATANWSAVIRQVRTSSGKVLATMPEPAPRAPQFKPAEDTLRFNFAAPTHLTDNAGRTHTEYRSKLDGFDRDWSEWTSETYVRYTNLPGRNYTFRVQARNFAGQQGREATFAFALPPPWWFDPWAWFAYGVTLCWLVIGIVHLRTAVLRRKNERLEKTVAARTEDLRQQNSELARLHQLELSEKITARLSAEKSRLEVLRYQLNPHFLFNSLTSIRSQIPPALSNARTTIDRLAEFCRLTLHGERPNDRTVVGEEIAMLRSYLDIEQTRMGELLRVDFEIDPTIDHDELPRLLLLPLVENALKYGQATSEDVLALKITVRRAGKDGVFIEIGNTGSWVEPGSRPGIPSLGIGHHNLKERLQRHYPDAHEFSHAAADGWVFVRLHLKGKPTGAT
ncbi:histidine kinase [Oleiharenicola lentus]|uniref:sensor histidine kinase n=1 Tax=Oleiharenicola lentus TaxID=2508720 RepID=UPI003F67E4FF